MICIIALKEFVDEVGQDVDYETNPSVMAKSQYPRHCEKSNKY